MHGRITVCCTKTEKNALIFYIFHIFSINLKKYYLFIFICHWPNLIHAITLETFDSIPAYQDLIKGPFDIEPVEIFTKYCYICCKIARAGEIYYLSKISAQFSFNIYK